MPKKRKLNPRMLQYVVEEIETAVRETLKVRSSIHSHFKKGEEVRDRWDRLTQELLRLRVATPSEIKKRISN